MPAQFASKADVSLIARAVIAYLSTDPDGGVPALGRCLVTLAVDTEEPPFVVVIDAQGETLAVYQVRDIGEGKTMLKRRKSRVGVLLWPAVQPAPARLTGYAWGSWQTETTAPKGAKNTLQPEGKKRRTR